MSTTVPLTTVYANTRNGTATYVQSDGTIATQSALLTRTDHWISGQRGRLLEPSRTNSIRNSTMVGAAAGTLDTTGALPTNWEIGGIATSDVTVATGTENGLAYVDLRLNGTPSTDIAIRFDGNTAISALQNQAWTESVWLKLQSGSTTNINDINLRINERTGSSLISKQTSDPITVTSTAQRFQYAFTMLEATAAYVVPAVEIDWTSGAIDITLRIYGPQMELGAFATTFIPTSTVAVPRLADRASVALSDIGFDAAGGSIFIEGRAYYDAAGSDTDVIFQIDDGTSDNAIQLQLRETGNEIRVRVVIGGSGTTLTAISYTSGDYFKVGIRYEDDNWLLSIDGSDSGVQGSLVVPSGLTTLTWQSNAAGGANAAAVFITKFATYAKEFADATLNAETA